jgi:hypothetical protein
MAADTPQSTTQPTAAPIAPRPVAIDAHTHSQSTDAGSTLDVAVQIAAHDAHTEEVIHIVVAPQPKPPGSNPSMPGGGHRLVQVRVAPDGVSVSMQSSDGTVVPTVGNPPGSNPLSPDAHRIIEITVTPDGASVTTDTVLGTLAESLGKPPGSQPGGSGHP